LIAPGSHDHGVFTCQFEQFTSSVHGITLMVVSATFVCQQNLHTDEISRTTSRCLTGLINCITSYQHVSYTINMLAPVRDSIQRKSFLQFRAFQMLAFLPSSFVGAFLGHRRLRNRAVHFFSSSTRQENRHISNSLQSHCRLHTQEPSSFDTISQAHTDRYVSRLSHISQAKSSQR
jgi:hypothetical protein